MKVKNFFSQIRAKTFLDNRYQPPFVNANPVKTLGADKGKHIYPRYLYHVTSDKCADSIVADGVIVTGKENLFGEGIFLFDLENFLKFWDIRIQKYGFKPLRNALINRAAAQTGNIAIFRIDTNKIDKPFLRIRSQNDIFDADRRSKLVQLCEKRGGLSNLLPKDKVEFNQYFQGESADVAPLFKQRKESIEYIYPFDILRNGFEMIGQTKVTQQELAKDSIYSVIKRLLNNQPEQKAVERFLNN